MHFGIKRVVIQSVTPQVNGGVFPVKKVVGESVTVQADIFSEGHHHLGADLLWKEVNENEWQRIPMSFVENDRWQAEFPTETVGNYLYTIEAWIDYYASWKEDLLKKIKAETFVNVDIEPGIQVLESIQGNVTRPVAKIIDSIKKKIKESTSSKQLLNYIESLELNDIPRYMLGINSVTRFDKELHVNVKRKKALFSTWYEFFPRSSNPTEAKHGTFKDCIKLIPYIASMGFDTIYFPPIHPIGKKNRKGANNTLCSDGKSPGSPWAIGSKSGGHDAINPELGTMADFHKLIKVAKKNGLEIAIDLAFQCSPDHPYLKKYPEWFKWRSDGTVQFAENPPKKYEDIVPFDFESEQWQELWNELKRVVLFWVEQGIEIFRVDNPHTKPFPFWEWLISEVNHKNPNVLFLSEAFTRPKVMKTLAKVGFDQSYTYFTWRNTKEELTTYVKDLIESSTKEYFRPNFWANTPDILPEYLQYGGKSAHIIRYALAATLSSNCGIYGPVYELIVNQAIVGKEEYLDSEKYEVKTWDLTKNGSISELISLINKARRENPALQTTWNTKFVETENDALIAYVKKAPHDKCNHILVVVNLDYHNVRSGMIHLPLKDLCINDKPYLMHDLITNEKYIWAGESNYVELKPYVIPVHIFKIQSEMKKENNFDYFM
ncbi:MAG: alpha-1,4-glucan--maltose-1-phosphate maltosyltransferase [Chlamydiota bacterium]|nr:alpha-1,4-glucan--maltose-1-phosphate maltosyltransferase [Chlamydiota bacterium]